MGKSYPGRLHWILALKIDSENWKCPICDRTQLKGLPRYQSILLGGSFKYKNLLNFTCLTIKFHNRHHTNVICFKNICMMIEHFCNLIRDYQYFYPVALPCPKVLSSILPNGYIKTVNWDILLLTSLASNKSL